MLLPAQSQSDSSKPPAKSRAKTAAPKKASATKKAPAAKKTPATKKAPVARKKTAGTACYTSLGVALDFKEIS